MEGFVVLIVIPFGVATLTWLVCLYFFKPKLITKVFAGLIVLIGLTVGPKVVKSIIPSSSSSSSSSKELNKIPFSQAIRLAEGCCSGGDGTWSSYDDCVGGNRSAITACIGKFIVVSSEGQERSSSDFMR